MERTPPPGAARVAGTLHRDGAREPAGWALAAEVPVGILANSEPVAVMMATPVDLEELSLGFLLAEGHVAAPQAVHQALVLPSGNGMCVDVAADPAAVRPRAARAMEGRSGCGPCGMAALIDLDLPCVERPSLGPGAVAAAFGALPSWQPMNATSRSLHAAAFADPEGRILIAREDVGRHTALDKLLGALARIRTDPSSGFAVMTSRCSFELVREAAIGGLGGLATRSAPTRLAVDLAARAGPPVACRAGGGVMAFRGASRGFPQACSRSRPGSTTEARDGSLRRALHVPHELGHEVRGPPGRLRVEGEGAQG